MEVRQQNTERNNIVADNNDAERRQLSFSNFASEEASS
jgi:hypothetical protein